jgi:hypothetical protein
VGNIFKIDENDKKRVFCIPCSHSYAPSKSDLKEHVKSQKHLTNLEKGNGGDQITNFVNGSKVARVEIIWSYLTVFRNLSFNLSDYAKDYLPHMFRLKNSQ